MEFTLTGEGKRTFGELQSAILRSLKKQPLAIHEISTHSKVNWNSTARQLILLKGKEYVKEIFSHKRLRIFQITQKGEKVLRR